MPIKTAQRRQTRITENKITKTQLNNFYKEVGRTIAEWLGNLECPNCKEDSSIDWMLQRCSEGKPQLVCRNCGKIFRIKGVRFKKVSVEPFTESIDKSKQKTLPFLVKKCLSQNIDKSS